MVKTFWLSFCDAQRPEGEQFLGACVIDVDDGEAAAICGLIALRFPAAADGAEWIGAATAKAHRAGCNPGGQVAFTELAYPPAWVPRGLLLQKPDIEALERRAASERILTGHPEAT
jgi:hypothetical protein